MGTLNGNLCQSLAVYHADNSSFGIVQLDTALLHVGPTILRL